MSAADAKIFTREFPDYRAAEEWLTESGYSYGFRQYTNPIGVMKGDIMISKWDGLSPVDRLGLDGRITWKEGTARTGTAVVTLKAAP